MEMLNNVWIALTTPNEGLMRILEIPLFFIEIPLTMYMFIYVLNINATRKQKLMYVVFATIVGIISKYIIPSPFNIIINYGMAVVLVFIIFKTSFLKSILSMIIPAIVFALVGILIYHPYFTILKITQEQFLSVPIYRLSYSAIFYLLILLINIIFSKRKFKLKSFEKFDRNTTITVYFNLIFGLIAIICQLIITFYYLNLLPIIITFISFVSLLGYFVVSIYSLTRIIKLALKTQELESAEAYNKSLSILHDNVRGFKHDFDNIVATIGGFVKTDDMDGLKKYYKELEDDCQRVNNIASLNPNLINNPGIFNLLSSKYYKADSKNIKINLEVFLDLNSLNMKVYEFSRILGILIDNAIEETEKCDEKIINIKFRNEHNKNRQVVIIENTYLNKDVNIDEIFNKGFSGKEDHSGLGLWEVKQILKKNNNLNLYTSKADKFFKQQLEIYNK